LVHQSSSDVLIESEDDCENHESIETMFETSHLIETPSLISSPEVLSPEQIEEPLMTLIINQQLQVQQKKLLKGVKMYLSAM